MPKQPKLPILTSGFTRASFATPHLEQTLLNWTQMAAHVVVTVPSTLDVPRLKHVHWNRVDRDVPSLDDVLRAGQRSLDAIRAGICVIDNASVMRFGIFDMFGIAANRHLSLAWLATSHPITLLDFDTPAAKDESSLAFFYAPATIWEFLLSRVAPIGVPFIQPIWSGWLANWAAAGHVHEHKYHDISALGAVGRFADAPEEECETTGFGPLTFNAPTRQYVTKRNR